MHRPHISKVFLDSRYALADGTFLIPGESILLEPNSRVWLGEFTCVASWDTLDDTNNTFSVVEMGSIERWRCRPARTIWRVSALLLKRG